MRWRWVTFGRPRARRPIWRCQSALAAAAVLLLSISGATACDDYHEEMALRPLSAPRSWPRPRPRNRRLPQQLGTPAPSQPAAAGAAAVEPHVRTAANDGQFGRRVAPVTATVPRAADLGAGPRRYGSPCLLCALHPLRCCCRSAAGVHAHVNERGMDYRLFKDRVGIPCCSKDDCRPAEKFVETQEKVARSSVS